MYPRSASFIGSALFARLNSCGCRADVSHFRTELSVYTTSATNYLRYEEILYFTNQDAQITGSKVCQPMVVSVHYSNKLHAFGIHFMQVYCTTLCTIVFYLLALLYYTITITAC